MIKRWSSNSPAVVEQLFLGDSFGEMQKIEELKAERTLATTPVMQ